MCGRGKLVLVLAAGLIVSQCTRAEDRILFEGEYFRAKASHVDRENRRSFIVQVNDIARSFEGAREAGRYEGTRYCVENYGTSEIAWASGPDDDPETLSIEKGRLSFRGTCLF